MLKHCPARGHDALPQWRAFLQWMSTERVKISLQTAIPGCPLVPLDNWNEGGLDSRFPALEAGRLFAARKQDEWADSGKKRLGQAHINPGRDSRLGTGGISSLVGDTRAAALFAQNRLYLRVLA